MSILPSKLEIQVLKYIGVKDLLSSVQYVSKRWYALITRAKYGFWDTAGVSITDRQEPLKPYESWEANLIGFASNLVKDRIWLELREHSAVARLVSAWPIHPEGVEDYVRGVVPMFDVDQLLLYVPTHKKDSSFIAFSQGHMFFHHDSKYMKKYKSDNIDPVGYLPYRILIDADITFKERKHIQIRISRTVVKDERNSHLMLQRDYFIQIGESLTEAKFIYEIFHSVRVVSKSLYITLSDPFKSFKKKATPRDELKACLKYQKAVMATLNIDLPMFTNPLFVDKFLNYDDIDESTATKIGEIFCMDQIRPDFPPLEGEGELRGYERVLGFIDTSGSHNSRDYGLAFGRRGLYVRNISLQDKLLHGGFVPYQVFSKTFIDRILPKVDDDEKKATSVRFAYGCIFSLKMIKEMISNSQIVEIFRTLIAAIDLVEQKEREAEELEKRKLIEEAEQKRDVIEKVSKKKKKASKASKNAPSSSRRKKR